MDKNQIIRRNIYRNHRSINKRYLLRAGIFIVIRLHIYNPSNTSLTPQKLQLVIQFWRVTHAQE